jgi:two-component system phosphate regulon response regulator OmpR
MLTAKGADADRISGLEAGADDYLPKPFNPQELLARIKRRAASPATRTARRPSQVQEVVSFGPWQLDLSTRQLMRAGKETCR